VLSSFSSWLLFGCFLCVRGSFCFRFLSHLWLGGVVIWGGERVCLGDDWRWDVDRESVVLGEPRVLGEVHWGVGPLAGLLLAMCFP